VPYLYENRKMPLQAWRFPRLTITPHIHPHLELIYLQEGESIAFTDGKEHRLEAGDLYLAFPNQIHYYHDQSPTSGSIVIFSAEILQDLQELLESKVPSCPVVKRDQLPPDVKQRIENVVEAFLSDSPFGRIEAKGELLLLMTKILPAMELTDSSASQDSVKNVLVYCMENYLEPLTLEKMARDLHMNKFYLSHIFNDRIKIGFLEFLNNLRVEHACKILGKEGSVIEVAYASGFSSIRTFNRVFREKTGMTPREYMQKEGHP